MDQALAQFFHEEFLDGGESSDAWKLMAALAFSRPDLGTRLGRLPRAARAAKGWSRLAPARSRLPLPWPVRIEGAAERWLWPAPNSAALIAVAAYVLRALRRSGYE